jgi:hypothetical protein
MVCFFTPQNLSVCFGCGTRTGKSFQRWDLSRVAVAPTALPEQT